MGGGEIRNRGKNEGEWYMNQSCHTYEYNTQSRSSIRAPPPMHSWMRVHVQLCVCVCVARHLEYQRWVIQHTSIHQHTLEMEAEGAFPDHALSNMRHDSFSYLTLTHLGDWGRRSLPWRYPGIYEKQLTSSPSTIMHSTPQRDQKRILLYRGFLSIFTWDSSLKIEDTEMQTGHMHMQIETTRREYREDAHRCTQPRNTIRHDFPNECVL